jgi:hypothetical protein
MVIQWVPVTQDVFELNLLKKERALQKQGYATRRQKTDGYILKGGKRVSHKIYVLERSLKKGSV